MLRKRCGNDAIQKDESKSTFPGMPRRSGFATVHVGHVPVT